MVIAGDRLSSTFNEEMVRGVRKGWEGIRDAAKVVASLFIGLSHNG